MAQLQLQLGSAHFLIFFKANDVRGACHGEEGICNFLKVEILFHSL